MLLAYLKPEEPLKNLKNQPRPLFRPTIDLSILVEIFEISKVTQSL